MRKLIVAFGLFFCKIVVAQIVIAPDILICPSCISSPADYYEQTENCVVIDPNNNLNAIIGTNSQNYPSPQSVGVFVTNDGGLTWDFNYSNVTNSYTDPTVSIDNNGFYYLGRMNNAFDIVVSRFQDINNLSSWQNQTVDNINLPDKPHLWIDNNSNDIYCAWTRSNDMPVDPKAQIYLSKSTVNSFGNWSSPIKITTNATGSYSNVGVNIQTGPQDQVYLTWAMYDIPYTTGTTKDEDGIGFASINPINLQVTFSKRILNIRGTRGTIGTVSLPSMAVNQQNGNIYIVWTNYGDPISGLGDADVYFVKSTDGGVTWSNPIRINSNPLHLQYYASIVCDPFSNNIAVAFLDQSNSYPDYNYLVALTNDEGATWYNYQVNTLPFSFIPGSGNDYLWIDMKNDYVVPVWNARIYDQTNNVYYINSFTSPFSLKCTTEINNLCNLTINTDELYRASNSIEIAGNSNNCFYNIQPGVDVSFQSGNYIKFSNGFHAEGGSHVHSYVKSSCNLIGTRTANVMLRKGVNLELADNMSVSLNLKAYPNPAENMLFYTFNLLTDNEVKISLSDIYGRIKMVKCQFIRKGFHKVDLDLQSNGLTSGLYFLEVSTLNETETIKFIKN